MQQLEEEEEEIDAIAENPAESYGVSQVRESIGADSVYSTVTDPRRSTKLAQNGYSNGTQYTVGPKLTHGIYKSPDNKIEELRVGYSSSVSFLPFEIQLTLSISFFSNLALII